MFLGIIAKFLGPKKKKKKRRGCIWKEPSGWELKLKTGEYAVQEKDKSASFSLQPYISWKLWAGFNIKKIKKKKKTP